MDAEMIEFQHPYLFIYMKKITIGEAVLICLITFSAILGVAFIISYPIMWIWNVIMPEMFGLRVINIWQALGLLVLCKILFYNFPIRITKHDK